MPSHKIAANIFYDVEVRRLLSRSPCRNFNETTNVAVSLAYTPLSLAAIRRQQRRLVQKNRRLCFCFACRQWKDFYCNFLISLRMLFQEERLSQRLDLLVAGFSLWLQQQTVHSSSRQPKTKQEQQQSEANCCCGRTCTELAGVSHFHLNIKGISIHLSKNND